MKVYYAEHAIIGTKLRVEDKVYIYVSDEGYIVRYSKNSPKNGLEERFEDSIIVPGFINLHTHIGDSFAKEAAYGKDVKEAVGYPNGIKHKLLREVDEEVFINGVRNAVREMFSSGVTMMVDFRENGVKGIKLIKKALKDTGIRIIILGREKENGNWVDVLKEAHGIGLPSLNHFSDNLLRKVNRLASSMGKYLSFHASESKSQRSNSIKKFGMTDLVRGLVLTNPSFVVHATNIDLAEIERLALNHIPVVICPRANAYLGSGIPPIAEMLKNRLIIGIGTDNVMINSPDIFREFDFVTRLIRLQNYYVDPIEILKMATKNATRILNLPVGILDEGFHADFFVFDLNKPNVAGMDDLIRAIVLRGKSENVIKTFVSGNIVFER